MYRGKDFTRPAWDSGVISGDGGPGAFVAVMQNDGNFVVYGPNDINQKFWATNSVGKTNDYFASLNDDGSFAVTAGTPTNPVGKVFITPFSDGANSADITSLVYDLADQVTSLPSTISGGSLLCRNDTPSVATCNVTLSLGYTKTNTWTWSESDALSASLKSVTKIGVPGLETSLEFSVTETTTITNGTSDAASEAKTFTGYGSIPVPDFSK